MSGLPPLDVLVEVALLAAGRPLGLAELRRLFPEGAAPGDEELRGALAAVSNRAWERGLVLREVAGGYRLEVAPDIAPWLSPLWNERPPRYSRALLETLALIAYRQPITRGEIEEIRGVSLATSILRTLEEREWIRVAGHRDVPGRPALYVTTAAFLEYFGLARLEDLPPIEDFVATAPGQGAGAESSVPPLALVSTPAPDLEARPTDAPTAGPTETVGRLGDPRADSPGEEDSLP